jgi:hypothetical protein
MAAKRDVYDDKEDKHVKKPSGFIKNPISQLIQREMNVNTLGAILPDSQSYVNEKILAIVTFAYAFVAQRIAQRISDWITNLGLDGRVDVLIIIVALCLIMNELANQQQSSMIASNKLVIQEMVTMITKRLSKNQGKNKKYIATNQDLEFFMSKISAVKHRIQWKTFQENLTDFFVLTGAYLSINYCEKFAIILFNMWNVSAETIVLVLIPILFFLISIKTSSTRYTDILKSEIRVAVDQIYS